MASHRLQVAIAGLGRTGARHAVNLLNKTPRAHLVAAFSPDEQELAWAKQFLEPYGVKLYQDYDAMLAHPDLEAVLIGTPTRVHAEQAIKAMQANLHVLCETPLSNCVDVCQQVVDEASRHPHLKVLCGFARRFDATHQAVAAKIQAGTVGRPSVLRTQACGTIDPSLLLVSSSSYVSLFFLPPLVFLLNLCATNTKKKEKEIVSTTVTVTSMKMAGFKR